VERRAVQQAADKSDAPVPGTRPVDRRMQIVELDYIAASKAVQTAIAENCVGLPL